MIPSNSTEYTHPTPNLDRRKNLTCQVTFEKNKRRFLTEKETKVENSQNVTLFFPKDG